MSEKLVDLNISIKSVYSYIITSLRASSPIWASEASLARTREAHFACPNRRACSRASNYITIN